MNRAEALAEALRASGYVCAVDHDVVQLVAPEHTAACVRVGASVDGYLCSFAVLPTHAGKDARAWATWTATVREVVFAAWPSVATLEIPAAAPQPPEPPEPPRETVYDHEWPLFAPVDHGLAHAYQAASREGRFVVVREWQTWDGPEGPRVTWHAWAQAVAAELGAARGWASVEGQEIAASHPAAEHVRRVLCEAARRVEAPGGIVALDMRGLTLATVEAVVRELVAAARSRCCDGWTRGGIVLCDAQTALYLNRSVALCAL